MAMFPVSLIVVAYLLGSVPFSYLIARIVTKDDIRTVGSGNVGATNVVRSAGKVPGFVALLLDIAKGFGSVMLARYLVQRPDWPWVYSGGTNPLEAGTFWVGLTALVAVLGHMFPVWLGFRGGKGVATATGAFFAVQPAAMGLALIVFIIVVAISRYISLGSMIAAGSLPVIIRFVTGGTLWEIVFTILIAFAVIVKHYSNIGRLARGEERRFPR